MLLLSGSVSLLCCSIPLGFDLSTLHHESTDLELKPYASPTLNIDPWESYNDEMMQRIHNKILEQEINEWNP